MSASPPKICHLTSVHPADDIRIFVKECTTAAAVGYDTSVVAPDAPRGMRNGVTIWSVPGRRDQRARRFTLTTWDVYRRAREIDADLYQFHDVELIFVGLLLRARGKHVVYDIHENVPGALARRTYLPRAIRPAVQWAVGRLELAAARRFSALVPATPAIGRRFERHNTRTVILNNYPLVDELVSPAPRPWSQRANAVAYIGLITPDRGAERMLEAVAALGPRRAVRLELAGRYAPEAYPERLRTRPGWKYVHERGLLGRPEVADLLGNVRAGLVLFLPGPNHAEAQPNKFFEYMAAGIPVIASDFPQWRAFIDQARCGLVVDPLDPAAIARAIEFVLDHPAEAEAMGRRGRALVETRFNWEAECPKLLALYAELVGEAPAKRVRAEVNEAASSL